jgi:hypothetical protein
MTRGVASFLVPVLTTTALLYRGLAAVDVSLAEPATIAVICGVLAAGTMLGLLAARGGDGLRIVVFSVTTVLLADTTVHPSRIFDAFERRAAARRDARRVADLHRIKAALDTYARTVGPLPEPMRYGEGTGPQTFWPGWWDLSSADADGDGHPFLDFLEERGVRVPLDPVNKSANAVDPHLGSQYVYFVVPAGYDYQGGACQTWSNAWVFVLGITDLETESERPPRQITGSGCACLWQNAPDFFQQHFDYVLCGTFQR